MGDIKMKHGWIQTFDSINLYSFYQSMACTKSTNDTLIYINQDVWSN